MNNRRIPGNRFLRKEVDDAIADVLRKGSVELDRLEEAHLLGYQESDGGREVLITRQNFLEIARRLVRFRMRHQIAEAFKCESEEKISDERFLRSVHVTGYFV